MDTEGTSKSKILSYSLKNREIQQQVRKLYTKAIDWYHFWIKSQGFNEGDNFLLFKLWGIE
ncbi:unnamed protein product [Paramecium sonneborni]|uniref:Uncharacterized protein n=1 Tax=Paramecium sonneborni TaxID=65129 RepID=A0A8S1RLU7_9CILI|nr:unnamed protein product [Paramecium sonneborni]